MNIQRNFPRLVQILKHSTPVRHFSKLKDAEKKVSAKLAPTVLLEVEKDTRKIATEVCGTNLYIEGGENIKLKPDSEYPDWLWKTRFGPPLPLEQLDPSTKEYWYRVRLIRKQEEENNLKFQKYKRDHK